MSGVATQRSEGSNQSEHENSLRTYNLLSGANVEVIDIPFGSVLIMPTDSNTAEVRIRRAARTHAELACNRIIVEHTPTRLLVRGNENRDCRLQNTSIDQSIIIKLPRQANLRANNITGPLRIGEIEGRGPNFVRGPDGTQVAQRADRPDVIGRGFAGSVRINSVSGPLRLIQGSGYTEITGISGFTRITVRRICEDGISVNGINGTLEILLPRNLNAGPGRTHQKIISNAV